MSDVTGSEKLGWCHLGQDGGSYRGHSHSRAGNASSAALKTLPFYELRDTSGFA